MVKFIILFYHFTLLFYCFLRLLRNNRLVFFKEVDVFSTIVKTYKYILNSHPLKIYSKSQKYFSFRSKLIGRII